MALPTLQSPKYTVEIPSNKKVIEYRPFLVKEEKIMLMAQESQDSREMLQAMKDIINACTFDKVDITTLTSFDLEYIFLKLRSKSVGEISNVKIECTECKSPHDLQINLDDIKVNINPDAISTIMLTDTIGVNLRYIRVKDMALLSDDTKNQSEIIEDVIIASMESIFDDTAVYPTDTSTRAELQTFINSLNRAQMAKIETFIAETPKLEEKINFKCKKCSHQNDIVLSGIQSFFE